MARVCIKLLLPAFLAAAMAARADVVEQGPKDAPPSGLKAGVTRADITPPVGIAQLNWGSQTHVEAVGIDLAGMVATALVLSDGATKLAMVDVDALFVPDAVRVIQEASARTRIPEANIRLAATHLKPKFRPAAIDIAFRTPIVSPRTP